MYIIRETYVGCTVNKGILLYEVSGLNFIPFVSD